MCFLGQFLGMNYGKEWSEDKLLAETRHGNICIFYIDEYVPDDESQKKKGFWERLFVSG